MTKNDGGKAGVMKYPPREILNAACPSPADLAIAKCVLMWLGAYYDTTREPTLASGLISSLNEHKLNLSGLIHRRSVGQPAILHNEYIEPAPMKVPNAGF